jgi:hypothetical protein
MIYNVQSGGFDAHYDYNDYSQVEEYSPDKVFMEWVNNEKTPSSTQNP